MSSYCSEAAWISSSSSSSSKHQECLGTALVAAAVPVLPQPGGTVGGDGEMTPGRALPDCA